MIDKNTFITHFNGILLFADVPVDVKKTKAFYDLLKDEFDNDEFKKICLDIVKTETLYNKYPTPKMFYDRKKQTGKMVLIEQGSFYIDDTMPQYAPYLKGMTDKQIENAWKWIFDHKYGEEVSEDWIIGILKKRNTVFVEKEPEITDERVAGLLSKVKMIVG